MLAALLMSHFAAAQHAGGCCSREAVGDASVVTEVVGRGDQLSCSHSGCRHGNPFRPKDPSQPSDAVHEARGTNAPASEHDGESCSLCRWFTILSSGACLDMSLAIECDNVTYVAASRFESQTAASLFLPALSRRGPPGLA
jgi:hypothetical protein